MNNIDKVLSELKQPLNELHRMDELLIADMIHAIERAKKSQS